MPTSDWQEVKLEEVLVELSERCGDRNLPVLSITKNRGIMLASERFGKEIHGRRLEKYRVAPRDCIALDPMLLWSGTIGRQKAVEEGIVSPDYRVYRAKEGARPEFLEYAFKGHQMFSQFKAGARGTNVRRNRISRSDFMALRLNLPSLQEQEKITTVLSSVDEAIERTQAVIDQVQLVKKGLMQELLTRGLPGRHTRFKQTEIGEIPEEWDVVPVSSVLVESQYGTSAKCTPEPTGHPVLRIPNVVQRSIDLANLKFTTLVPDKDIEKYSVRPGDVLVIRTNGNPSYVGRTAVVEEDEKQLLFASYLIRLRVKADLIRPHYLHLAFQQRKTRRTLDHSIRTSAGNYNLNTKGIGAALVALPPLPEQKAIESNISVLDERLVAEDSGLDQLRQLKKALMSVLLTGEVRVQVEEVAA